MPQIPHGMQASAVGGNGKVGKSHRKNGCKQSMRPLKMDINSLDILHITKKLTSTLVFLALV